MFLVLSLLGLSATSAWPGLLSSLVPCLRGCEGGCLFHKCWLVTVLWKAGWLPQTVQLASSAMTLYDLLVLIKVSCKGEVCHKG